MAGEAKTFIKAVAKATNSIPVYPPGRDVSLGDIGVFEGGEWIRKTSLKDEGIPFKVHIDRTPASRISLGSGTSWKVSSNIDAELNVPTPVPGGIDAKARLEVALSGSGSFAMDAYGLLTHEITNLDDVEEEILKRDGRRDGSWEYEWCVISQIVEAERSFVAVSNSREATAVLDLGVEPDGAFLDLAAAQAGARVASSSHMAAANLNLSPTPLTFKFRKLRDVLSGGPVFTGRYPLGVLLARIPDLKLPRSIKILDDGDAEDLNWEKE